MAETPFLPPDAGEDASFLDAAIRYLDNALPDDRWGEFQAVLAGDPAKVQLLVDTCLAGKLIAESLGAAWNAHRTMPDGAAIEPHDHATPTGEARDTEAKEGEEPSLPSPVAALPHIVVTPSAATAAVPTLFGYVSQVGPLSYLISALFMCFAALVAWQCNVNEVLLSGVHEPAANVVSTSDRKAVDRAAVTPPHEVDAGETGAVVVARVTDMQDCQWAKKSADAGNETLGTEEAELAVSSQILSGRQIGLDSGLLEIAYDTGAKVILQGPAVFQVSDRGGFLGIGRLTGKLEKRSVSQPVASSPVPFAIHTPSAVVTDLGTEFGVEVDRAGGTTSHVFRGSVQVRAVGWADDHPSAVLRENESVQVEPGNKPLVKVSPASPDSDRFVREIRGRRIVLPVFNTGAGCKEQSSDPHWQIVAVSNDPEFQPRQALVTTPNRRWRADAPERSQWISMTPRWQQFSPNDVTYTFRTSFELGDDVLPETAVLKGWFIADNMVRAIRLNGKSEPVPDQVWDAADLFRGFTLKQGFVRGTNMLEFDVENLNPVNHRVSSPMGLRVDLEGSVRAK